MELPHHCERALVGLGHHPCPAHLAQVRWGQPCPVSWIIAPGPWPVRLVSSLLTSDVPKGRSGARQEQACLEKGCQKGRMPKTRQHINKPILYKATRAWLRLFSRQELAEEASLLFPTLRKRAGRFPGHYLASPRGGCSVGSEAVLLQPAEKVPPAARC